MEAATIPEVIAPQDEPEESFVREVESSLPAGEDRPAMMLRVDYLLQRIREEEARAEEIAQFTARRIAMVQEHGRTQLHTIERRVQWLKGRVMLHVPATGEGMQREFGKKSLALPHGKVGFRATPSTVKITDMPTVVAWAKKNGVPVDTAESVRVAHLKHHLAVNGEVAEGAEYIDGSERSYVEVTREDA